MSLSLEQERHPAAVERTLSVARPQRVLRTDIQGLRAIAVTLVVLYHAHVPGIRAGYVGVDVFFVISGFLITGQIVREVETTGRLSLSAFYARRMRRLLPAAMLVVAATLLAARQWGPILQLRSTATDAVWTALYAINFRLAAEGLNYQQADGSPSPLQHFWSLAVEEQFYLVWPLLIVATLVVRRSLRRVVLAAVAAAGSAFSFYLCVTLTATSAPTAYFSVQTRAWEFGLGALVALGTPMLRRVNPVLRGMATWAGLGFIAGSAVVYDDGTAFPGIAAIVPVLGCALVIAGGCGSAPWRGAGALLDRGPVQAVGKFSYAWYLWHWPMLVLAPYVLGYQLSWIRNVEVALLALWLAGLTYAIVELPTRRGRVRRGRWLIRGLALSGAIALISGLVATTTSAVAGSGDATPPIDLQSAASVTLTRALDAAAVERDVPANLTPALSAASADVPVTEGGCHLGLLQTRQGPCVYGDPLGQETVVLFGDSHAEQWDGALDAEAKLLRWRLLSWTKSACPVADVSLVHPTLKRVYTECDTWRAATIDRIERLHPALVIASQSDEVAGQMVSNNRWAQQTGLSLLRLKEPGTRVVFLADTPAPKGDVPACVAAHRTDVSSCNVPRSQAYHDLEDKNAALYLTRHEAVSSAVSSVGIQVVDPIDWLCGATECPPIVGDALIYRDYGHLTNTYSTELGPLFRPLLTLPLHG